jgi:hypothetical protein
MYKLTNGGVIHPSGFFIPNNTLNADWQEYQVWLEDNDPLPADPPPPLHEGEIAQGGTKQWFIDNPQTQQIFTLSIANLETEISTLVDALFPSASVANKTKTKKLWMVWSLHARIYAKERGWS